MDDIIGLILCSIGTFSRVYSHILTTVICSTEHVLKYTLFCVNRHVQIKVLNIFWYTCLQVVAEDLGSKFNAQAREAWRLVLLFILTELKRGFTQCLRDKSAQRSAEQTGQPTSDNAAAAAAAALRMTQS